MVFLGKKLGVASGAKALPDEGQDTILADEFGTFIAACHAQLLAKEDHFSIIAQMTDPDSQLSRLIDSPLA